MGTDDTQLGRLVREAGMSFASLARAVNALGTRAGQPLTYTRAAVYHWATGNRTPPDVVQALVLSVLSDRLGRDVTPDQLSWPSAVRSEFAPLTYLDTDSVCTALPEFWKADMLDRRGFLAGAAPVALAPALIEYLTSGSDRTLARTGGARVGPTDVQMIRDLTTHLRAMEHRYGAGRFRPDAVTALHHHVGPLLRGTYNDATGRQLWAAASELSTIVAWMSVDTDRPGLASRYLTSALRLARGARDPATAGYALSRMAHVAFHNRQGHEVIQCARAAQQITGEVTSRMKAEYHLVEALGHGVLGDQAAVRRSVDTAMTAWHQGSSEADPVWQGLDLAQANSLAAEAHLRAGAARDGLACAADSIAAQNPDAYPRRMTSTYLHQAESAHAAGDIELAVDATGRAAKLANRLTSPRLSGKVLGVAGQLAATGNPGAVALRDRLAVEVPA